MHRVERCLRVVLLVGVAACATAPVEGQAQQPPTGGQEVTIEMIRFTFRPDVVTLRAGVPATIRAVSVSSIPHNITILSPDGQPLKAVDIPAKGTEILEVTLSEPGSYVFYCDKFLHRWPFGMEGTLVVR